MHEVRLYFDLISPYAWLALRRARSFAAEHDVAWDLRPVVLAKLLDASDRIGPAETAAQRRYTMRDVARCAAVAGATVQGPPTHPFRSLEALRLVCLHADDPRVLDLAVALADAAWERGVDLTDVAVLRAILSEANFAADDLAARVATREIKDRLRASTDAAAAVGVFGVPTFEYAGELFWGHDRMEHLAARLAGRLPDTEPVALRLLERPADHRARAPLARSSR